MVVALKEAKEVIDVLDTPVTLIRVICDRMAALDIAVGDEASTITANSNKLDELHHQIDVPIEFQWVRAHTKTTTKYRQSCLRARS